MRVDVGATLRNLAGPVVARALRVEVRGAHRVPRRGPLVVACQDGDEGTRWILRSLLPRPVHVVPGDEGPAIDVQFDAVSRLAEGQAVAFAGAHPAPGFTALASGAPVLPADIATDPVGDQRHPVADIVGQQVEPGLKLIVIQQSGLKDQKRLYGEPLLNIGEGLCRFACGFCVRGGLDAGVCHRALPIPAA